MGLDDVVLFREINPRGILRIETPGVARVLDPDAAFGASLVVAKARVLAGESAAQA